MSTTNRDERRRDFLTSRAYAAEQAERIESPRGRLLIASCRSGSPLASRVVERYEELLSEGDDDGGVSRLDEIDFEFSDGETCVRLETDVNGHDVFLFQALYDPVSPRSVNDNYLAFLIAVRAFREWGANHVTGVLPYLAYARQDKPTKFQREPTTAELMADLSVEAGLDRLVVWNPHTAGIHGFYGSVPIDGLSPLAMFVDAFRRFEGRDDVIAVAPDAGATKLIMHFSRALDLSSAIASKYRPRPEKAEVAEIMGDFEGKRVAIVLDDMINTGGTMEATVEKLVAEKGIEEVYIGVSHNLCTDRALERVSSLHTTYQLRQLLVTDSVPQTDRFCSLPFVTMRSVADPLARVINRIHYNRSVDAMFARAVLARED
ncbi:MAG: ribose-phosphate diphosphokinase [Chloroflexota bacterium]|nr:ribose-phosphate diphosphokinase [Chloroflexota bacterium]